MEITFRPAPEVEQIARGMIVEHHKRLRDAQIGYLFRSGPWTIKGRTKFGQARKLSALDMYLASLDFVILINSEIWPVLTEEQQAALVDHELSHCGRNENGDWTTYNHDVEDFIGVVQRNGFWTRDLQAMVAHQVDIFEAMRGKGVQVEIAGGDGKRLRLV